jgi:hypothetical protein
MITRKGFAVVAVAVALCAAGSEASGANFTSYRGMCDASAVVTIGNEHFVVADDEDNILRVYSRQNGGTPQQTLDLSPFLRVDPQEPEADLEGAAPLGDRVYWITSHARNKNGKHRPSRHRFFATTIVATNGSVTIKPVGFAYARLLTDLLNEPRLRPFNLAAAAQREPKAKDALNIEGLCATPDGALLLGFRNPNPNGKALLVRLLNPADLTEGKTARFGDPLLLDLGGRGIRSIARSGQRYFIIAGSYDGAGPSSLYVWNGGSEVPQLLPQPGLTGLNPEAIEGLTENGVDRLFVVSDDGTRKIGSQDCKDVTDPNLKYFRGTTIDL